MRSAGNDIVALKAVDQQRTHHPRFYSKILSEAEHTLYDRQLTTEMLFENFVWLLWSVKESVYKYLKRTEPDLIFSPTKIIIHTIDSPGLGAGAPADPGQAYYKGTVRFGPHSFYFQSRMHPEYIAAVVNDKDDFENIWWGIRSIGCPDYDHQSIAVRTFALDQLYSLLAERTNLAGGINLAGETDPVGGTNSAGGMDRKDLHIKKNPQGCPIVYNGAREIKVPLSLAHHDHYISWCFYFNREGRSVIS